jgi:hypothetical protein
MEQDALGGRPPTAHPSHPSTLPADHCATTPAWYAISKGRPHRGVKTIGSSSLLVIQVHGSKIATSEEKVVDWKILINQWRNEHSLRD